MKLNERFNWAVKKLALQPTDHVLEIGCGVGILVQQMATQLKQGKITAIDRSPAMISSASKRNYAFTAVKKVEFVTGDFVTVDLKSAGFDKIVAFNVNFFWRDSETEMQKIHQCLKPAGELFIFWQPPFNIDIKAAEPIEKNLEENRFEVVDTILKNMKPTSAICIIARVKK